MNKSSQHNAKCEPPQKTQTTRPKIDICQSSSMFPQSSPKAFSSMFPSKFLSKFSPMSLKSGLLNVSLKVSPKRFPQCSSQKDKVPLKRLPRRHASRQVLAEAFPSVSRDINTHRAAICRPHRARQPQPARCWLGSEMSYSASTGQIVHQGETPPLPSMAAYSSSGKDRLRAGVAAAMRQRASSI